MGVFEDLANQKPGMHWQHDRHHTTMLANPYDPSRDLSPNLPTTSCRGQEQLATNAYDGVHGQCGCSAFKSEFDDECGGGLHPSTDCCGDKLQLLHQVPPATMGVVVGGGGVGDDYRGGPLQAVQPCKLLQDDSSSPVHMQQHHHHVQHHLQQQQHHRLLHHHHHPVVGYHAGSSPEPPSPGMVQSSSYGEAAYDSSPPDVQRMLRPKREEEPAAAAAAAAAAELNLCDGCGLKILDRYYLLAVDKRWHATCLQCFQCSRTLATEIKCFYRDGNIYCKSDYQRLYAGVVRRCGRCQTAISPSELVMRARDTVYHVPCFSCAVCATALTKGDQFGMRDGAVFCQHHYRPQQPVAMRSPAPHQVVQRRSPPQQQQTAMTPPAVCAVRSPYPSSGGGPLESPAAAFFCNGGSAAAAAGNAADAPAPQPRQKGRPRKRKPKDLQDAMAANMDMNSSDSYNMEMAFGPGGLSGAGGNGGPGSGHQRTKRMRTSFKHHQLRTMKSYFHHNHNPDAKDLKQLSQKTGLPKRVLQVWFQNARAKYRRTASKQDGGGLGSLQGPPSIKPEKSCSESSTGSTGIEAVMFHQQQQQQQQQHHSMQMSPRSYLSSSSPMMECT